MSFWPVLAVCPCTLHLSRVVPTVFAVTVWMEGLTGVMEHRVLWRGSAVDTSQHCKLDRLFVVQDLSMLQFACCLEGQCVVAFALQTVPRLGNLTFPNCMVVSICCTCFYLLAFPNVTLSFNYVYFLLLGGRHMP